MNALKTDTIVFDWCCLLADFHGLEKHHIDTTFDEWLNDKSIEHDNNHDSLVDETDYEMYLETI